MNEEIFKHVKSCLTLDENNELTTIPTSEEIWNVVRKSKPNKAPGPNGFPVSFFKHNWEIVGDQMIAVVHDFFINRNLHKDLNKKNLFLIPKIRNPKSDVDFRPIRLCNTPYKVIAKLMGNRFKKVLEKIIYPLQSDFLSSRQISDNIIVAHEIVHSMKKSRRRKQET